MKISVIFVNYHSEILINNLLKLIPNNIKNEFDIFVFDNSNTFIKQTDFEFNLNILKNKRNIGFGAAINLVIKKINTNYFILLNPDIVFDWEELLFFCNKIKNLNVDIASGSSFEKKKIFM